MDETKKKKKKKSKTEVPLPSASDTEQTILEKQNLVKIPQVVSVVNEKKAEDTQSVHSESDNEVVKEEKDEILNLDDEFEKIVPSKIDDFDGIAVTDEDREIVEIFSEKSTNDDATTNINIEATATEEIEKKIQIEAQQIDREKEEIAKSSATTGENEVKSEITQDPVELETFVKEEPQNPVENIEKLQDENSQINEQSKETIIDEDLLPRETILKIIAEESDKPSIPLQTYLWEDVKRAKEQGGYPWTHLYKQPLGPDEEPEVILTYEKSPKSGRRAESVESTPRSQKKVRIQDEVDVQEPESDIKEEEEEEKAEKENSEKSEAPLATIEEIKKSPKSILKRSQKILENIKPNTSKFDSDSLKRKIKSPLARIKTMADNQLKKVKSSGTKKHKKIPVSKEKILLNEEVKILKLKESPKSQHREVATYIVKQDSDETIDIVELDQSPSELRKQRREVECGIVTPDEIIDLPVSSDNDKVETTDSCKNEEVKPRRKEHHYEDIDELVANISSDAEHVNWVHEKNEQKFTRQDHFIDPIFDEFSRALNKQIRKSLSAQDDSIRQELTRKIPKIEELEKQISDEGIEEKVVKSPHLLAPISSIDSTSSDEDRAKLSMVAEESENSDSKKKSFEHEPSLDILEIESLKADDSDNETTLVEEIKEEILVKAIKKIESELKTEKEESKKVEEEIANKLQKEEIKIENKKEEEISKESQENEPQNDETDLKEDIEIKSQEEEEEVKPKPIKISAKWSKMRKVKFPSLLENQTSPKGKFKFKKLIERCFPII